MLHFCGILTFIYLFVFIYVFYVYGCFVCMFVCTPEEDFGYPRATFIDGCEVPGIESGPLEKQPVLLTIEPSL